MHRREIPGVSGWELVSRFVLDLPEETQAKLSKCESPIERLLASACGLVINQAPKMFRPALETQVQIGRYRADIVLTGPLGAPRIVVECDGAEYHKDRARDAKRTEAIEREGYRVFRRTGSEIHHNPLMCAKSLMQEAGFIV